VKQNPSKRKPQLGGDFANRLYYVLASGLENNGLFGFETTPRASLTYDLVRPGGKHIFNGTKLHASFGKGIKEPSICQEFSSLFGVLSTLINGPQLIQQFGV
jgi:iron complex outermembrane receptor protein/vitamin B12 transporter